MSFDMPEDRHSKDTALARLLAQALSRSKSNGTVQASACPDAEVLAAYAERGLAEDEASRWESHFADCSRCQKIIAVLAASEEELIEGEVVKLGNLAATSPINRERVVRNAPWWTLIWRRPSLWRWLVPAAGLASAAGLWLALHHAPPRETLSAQKIPAAIEASQNAAGPGANRASSAKPDETQIAQASAPPPPAALPRSEAVLRDKEAAPAESSTRAKKEQAQKQETFSNAIEAPRNSENERAVESREDAAKDNRLQSAQSDEKKSPMSDALSAAAPAAPVASPPPAPPPARELDRAERQATERAAGAPAATQLKALALAASPAIVVASPNRRVLWRLGSGGRLERSTDQGQTWQAQSSGVTADLLAGAAPSERVAWVVGRNGIILRTEDGEHWQRAALPSATQPAISGNPAPDWTGIEARDALHATIISRDLRRYATEDGGRTWDQVQ
jgi:hypothetical protein